MDDIEVLSETVDQKMERLETRLRAEIQADRIERAEKFADRLNKWMTAVIAVVTLLLAFFGVLGYKSYEDIKTSRDRVQKLADDVTEKAKEIDNSAIQAEQRMAELQQVRIDTTNLQTNLATMVGSDPIILEVPQLGITPGTVSVIEGKNFGKSKGHLYVLVQAALGSTSEPIEIDGTSIGAWSDNSISLNLGRTDELTLINAARDLQTKSGFPPYTLFPFLAFSVGTSEGKRSGWSRVTMFYDKEINQNPLNPLILSQ